MSSVVLENEIEIPMDIVDLATFRRWSSSEGFPETGRIDYLAGRIEVDMSPENLYAHGTAKVTIVGVLYSIVSSEDLGELFSDRTRVVHPGAELSAEPDVVFVSWERLESGEVRAVQCVDPKEGFIELEGSPDLVVEVVSKSSVNKDTQRLPGFYFRAGVREYWLIDARKDRLSFQILRRGADAFEAGAPDDQPQFSPVLDRTFELTRKRNRQDHWQYQLHWRRS